MASRLKGSKASRRIFKALPDTARDELVDVFEKGGSEVAQVIRRRIAATTRKRSGKLLGGVAYKVDRKALRLRVGFLNKRRDRPFYARILDLGRRAQTVTVTRRGKAAIAKHGFRLSRGRKVSADIVTTYKLRVRPIAAKRFVTGRYGDLREIIGRRLRGVWDRVLGRIAGGQAND